MDIYSMTLPSADGQKYIREFDDSGGGHLGFAHHNVSYRFKMMIKTCRNRSGVFNWERTFQEVTKLIDRQMNGKVDKVAL